MFKKIWTPDMIQDVILSANGKEPLNSHYFSTNHPSVYAAAERLFGSWGNAITASGLDYKAIRKYHHSEILRDSVNQDWLPVFFCKYRFIEQQLTTFYQSPRRASQRLISYPVCAGQHTTH